MTQTMTGSRVEHEIGSHGRLHVAVPAGEVHIRAIDGPVVTITERTGRALDADFTIHAASGSLALRARTRFALSFDRPRPVLSVGVPRSASVAIETASADVTAEGLQGAQRYRTTSASVVLRGVAGSIAVDAVSGDVHVDGGDLALEARTVSGDVDVRAGRLLATAVSTTSGRVRLDAELTATGAHGIRTVSGDATVATSSGLRVEARTLTGEIAGDRARRATGPGLRHVIVGDGGVDLAFSSLSGDLRVVHPEAAGEVVTPEAPVATADAVGGRTAPRTTRLDVLRTLERGEIDVATAMRQLANVEDSDV